LGSWISIFIAELKNMPFRLVTTRKKAAGDTTSGSRNTLPHRLSNENYRENESTLMQLRS
jgi:hypothetical protein